MNEVNPKPTSNSLQRPGVAVVIVLLVGAFLATTLFYQMQQRERERLARTQVLAGEVLDDVGIGFVVGSLAIAAGGLAMLLLPADRPRMLRQ